MSEFFIELFSEEIPARMQRDAAAQLEKLCASVLAPLHIHLAQSFFGPRRFALHARLSEQTDASVIEERGPRLSAPEQALAGFLRKHDATQDQLVQEGEFWVLRKNKPARSARELILEVLPPALEKFSWPKSMRWGQGAEFTWVRPLRRMVCLLDGGVIPIQLGPVTAGNETEGHRVLAPGIFAVGSAVEWVEKLRENYVIADAAERRDAIVKGIADKAAALGLSVAPDEGLLDEVTGLVEWPVPLIGKIDAGFMDLPPEVRELSMKINQKYFALRDDKGEPAPYFAFVANLAAEDSGLAIIAGNERVLRARLADARHFWDLDLKTPLSDLLPKLEKITFHAEIGTQRKRVDRISELAGIIAHRLDASGSDCIDARQAGLYCKADLTTGMVGEFPELQGIMGGYYAEKAGGAGIRIGPAIKTHYQPKGPSDAVPTGTIAVSVALADKLDTLREFFRIGEKPTGSGDPYALRRAALGVIRIILENGLLLPLKPLLVGDDGALFDFIIERLRVKLRGEGKRFDVLDAVLSADENHEQIRNDDLVQLMKRVDALGEMLGTDDGRNLLAAYKRARNIVEKEAAKDNSIYVGDPKESLLQDDAEKALAAALDTVWMKTELTQGMELSGFRGKHDLIAEERFPEAMTALASLRPAIDTFFEKVTVNATEPEIRHNRLQLLSQFVEQVNEIADFSKIEG
jgi:glycyl-tRNA synthetase beta chain